MSSSKVDATRLKAPTAKRIWTLATPSAVAIRTWLEEVLFVAPESMNRAKLAIYGFERHFKGAIWELFWWFHLSAICTDIQIEARTNHKSSKSVDFLATFPSGNLIALEVSTLSENYENIQIEYDLDELHFFLEESLYGPYKLLQMEPIKFVNSPDVFKQILDSLISWLNDISYSRAVDPSCEPSFRLSILDKDVLIDFRALGYDPLSIAKPGILRTLAPREVVDEKERLRSLILRKAEKKIAVPDCPLVIAITESGGFMSGSIWSRATALIGDEYVRVYHDNSHEVVYSDNGIFLGASGWRNTEISAVILSAANVPSSDFGEYEIWLHGGADFVIEPEDLGFKARYLRISSDCVEEFQGFESEVRWKNISIH
jgi:hypothetical protein